MPSRSSGGLFKTKSDFIWAGICIIVVIGIVWTIISNIQENRPDAGSQTYKLSDSMQDKASEVITDFLSSAGTFGLDWDATQSDKTVTMQEIHDSWLMNLTNQEQMDPEVSSKITTRAARLYSLKSVQNDKPSLLSPRSAYADKKLEDKIVTSDAMWESGFKTSAASVKLNWKNVVAHKSDNGYDTVTVPVSWATSWTRATVIPAMIDDQGPSQADGTTTIKEWNPGTVDLSFKNVQITLQLSQNGKTWQVYNLKDGDDSKDLTTKGFALAVVTDVKYDPQTGIKD